jgi:hypothetical protein
LRGAFDVPDGGHWGSREGGALCYPRRPPSHGSFDLAKATHARIAHLLSEGLSVFCEYCYAVHSIEYSGPPDHSLVFGARDDQRSLWWEWDMIAAQARDIDLPTVPLLFRGEMSTESELLSLTTALASEPSAFGLRRPARGARGADDHWMHQAIRVQPLCHPAEKAEGG